MSGRLRPVEQTMVAAVSETLDALDLRPEDRAAARLALEFARVIDGGQDPVDKFGAMLLRVLQQLGATPASRSEIGRRVYRGRAGRSELERLREARRSSPDGAA
jgi:hypothetical protein